MTEEQVAPETNGQVRDFGATPIEEGPSFSLGGQTFRTKKHIPPKALMTPLQDGAIEVVSDFIAFVVVKEDRQRFLDLVNDPDAPITTEQVGDVSNWLVELHSNSRPTSA